jgi:RimJ/RimL family protein N-acetyltransferase
MTGDTRPRFERLETTRLVLRRLQSDDGPALCAYRSLPEVARLQGWETWGPEDAARLIETQTGSEPAVPGTWFQLAIIEKAGGKLIGDCGLHCLQGDPRQMELGVTLAPAWQGRGYATEAMGSVIEFLFGPLNMHRISAITGAENHAAAALFHRLGFRREGHFIEHRWYKGHWESEFVFGLLQREWAETAGAVERPSMPRNSAA